MLKKIRGIRKVLVNLKKSLKLRSEEGTGEHRFEDTENDEGQNGTIYNANSGKGNAKSGTCN